MLSSVDIKQIKERAAELVEKIKTTFVNQNGLLSSTYPPSEHNLLAHFDDYVPFLLYFNEVDFVRSQILASIKFTYDGLIPQGRLILSDRNDEYLGALLAYYRHTNEPFVYELIVKALEGIRHLLIRKGFLCSYHDIKRGKTPLITSPRTGCLLEVLLQVDNISPRMSEDALTILDNWLQIPFFNKYGLFPSKYYLSSRILNAIFERSRLPMSRIVKLASQPSLLYQLPMGTKVQVMKDNTNFIFALMAAYTKTSNRTYKNVIIRWVDGIMTNLFRDGFIFKFWSPQGDPEVIELTQNFAVVDILCDIYWFINRYKRFLEFAEKIASSWIKLRWDNGLFPRFPGAKHNHLDEQTDFCISLMRLYELTGKRKYRAIAEETISSVLEYHHTHEGYVLSVNDQGKVVDGTIAPKYNALLLKALILLIDDRNIYTSESIHDLMEDR